MTEQRRTFELYRLEFYVLRELMRDLVARRGPKLDTSERSERP